MRNFKLYITLTLLLIVSFATSAQQTTTNGLEVSDTDKNWMSIHNFDIQGKVINAAINFYDDLGKATQSQVFDFKESKVWASETLYDHQGRPALSTLSAPIGDQKVFIYKNGFIKKMGGLDFTINDYEKADIYNPTPVDSPINTLGWYFSKSNTLNLYQDITDRPYSRTIYSELNPGTVLKTIGGNKMDGEWKTGYSFSMPAGQELAKVNAFNNPKYNTNLDYKIIKTVVRDVHGVESVVFSDTDGRTLAAARSGNEERNTSNNRTSFVTIGEQGYVDVHIPVGRKGISISGSNTTIYDLITEQTVITSAANLPNGFYRIAVNNLDTYNPGTITVTYPENYYDYSLNEYDKAGRLLSSKQPLKSPETNLKLETTFTYNSLGQLTYTKSPDEGEAWFKYRNDGQIRYSQNSKQKATVSDFNATEEFSYTNYDDLGRPIESGVFYGAPKPVLFQNLNPDSFSPLGSRKEQHITTYDAVDRTELNSLPAAYRNPTFLSSNVAKTWNENTTTYYSYDIYGRVQWIVQDIKDLGIKTIDYEYDPVSSQVTKVYYQKGQSDQFIHRYSYDPVDYTLTKVETSTNNSNFTEHASYGYYVTGELKRIDLAEGLQGIDYVYNLNGALKSINHPNLVGSDPGIDGNDLFGMVINYYNGDYTRTGTPRYIPTTANGIDQFNGNIKSIIWSNQGNTTKDTYYYDYNKNNWLQGASFNESISENPANINPTETRNKLITATEHVEASQSITLQPGFHITATSSRSFSAKIGSAGNVDDDQEYNVYGITYDANGNIQSLNRNKDGSSSTNKMDQLSYAYKTDKPNQLLRVDDAAGDVAGADDIGDQDGNNYVYNEIGQLVENKEENIVYLYNASGLVTEVQKDENPLVKFFYNDKNHRVRKESYNPTNGSLVYTEFYIRDAAGTSMAIYRKDGNGTNLVENTIYGASRLGVRKSDGSKYYQLTDHLGNVRAVVGRTNSGQPIAMTTATDYYPGGMAMPGRDLVGDYRYGYQGQEVDPETGKPAFELRLYDPRINRWLTTDPAGQHASPYLSMSNNWINSVDPDGGYDNPVYGSNGEYRGTTKEGFTGEAIIYDGDVDFSNLSKGQLTSSSFGGTFLSNFNFSDQSFKDNIISHIANFQLGDGLDLSVQVCIQCDPSIGHAAYNATNATAENTVIRRGSYNDQYFEPTVENLRNVINLHEVGKHTLANIGGSSSDHIKIYQAQVNHKQFKHTTRRFKQFTALNYASVGGDFNVNKNFINLYNNYGRGILQRYDVWQNSSFNSTSPQYFSIFK